jgi:hypothetical protein
MKETSARIGTVLTMMLITILVLAVPASASGRPAKTTHQLTGSLRVKTLETGGGYPGVGGTYTYVGLVELRLDGKTRRGVLESRGSITGQPGPVTISAEQDDRSYLPEGSFRTASTATAMVNPDGSVATEFESTIEGGSGEFKGARGKITATCSVPTPDPNAVVSCELKGTIAY